MCRSTVVDLWPPPVSNVPQVFKVDNLERSDEDTPFNILRQLQHYTQQESAQNEVLYPKISALEGFAPRPATDHDYVLDANLLELGLDDQEEVAEDALAAMKYSSAEWKPACGNIKILTKAIAESIVALTGTAILPEPAQHLVRLINGDFNLALEKLNNLEPLLKFQFDQRDSNSSKRVGNVLIMTDTSTEPRFGFQMVAFPYCPAYQRVIVPPQSAKHLPKQYVCEARIREGGGSWTAHPNLNPANTTPISQILKFQIWDRQAFKEMGDLINMKENTQTGPVIQSRIGTVPKMGPQNYLDPSKAAELQDWSLDIQGGINPDDIPPEAPPAEKPSGRRRQIRPDPDDEDEDEEENGGLPERLEPVGVYGANHDSAVDSASDSLQSRSVNLAATADLSTSRVGTFEDDGQLLPGLHHQGHRSRASPPSSTIPSNLMSMSSETPPYIDSPRRREAAIEPDSPPLRESARRRKPKPASDSEDDLSLAPAYYGPSYGQVAASDALHVRNGSRVDSRRSRRGSPSVVSTATRTPSDIDNTSEFLQGFPIRGRGARNVPSRGANGTRSGANAASVRPPPGLRLSPATASPHLSNSVDTSWSRVMQRNEEYEPTSTLVEGLGKQDVSAVINEKTKKSVRGKKFEGIDVESRRAQAIKEMQQQANAQDALAAAELSQGLQHAWSTVPSRGKSKKSRGGLHHRVSGDDVPRYHDTMGQRAGNPGKQRGRKKPAPTRQQLIDAAYGDNSSTSSRSMPTASQVSRSEMSSAKKKLLNSNPLMAYENSDAREQELRVKETASLTTQLKPLFEHSRAFSGQLDFGIHIGQVLVPTDPHTDKSKGFHAKHWERTFGPGASINGPLSSFTPVLTTNGADIDRALEKKVKPSSRGGSVRMFDESSPDQCAITYEFHCQTKTGESFLVDVKDDLTYDVRNSTESLGTVCIHCPCQVWDACAILHGAEYWRSPPLEVQQTIESFVQSIYVAPGRDLSLFFREPPGNIVAIKNPNMKRVSLHSCLLPGFDDVLLRVTEHTALSTQAAPQDKGLRKAIEPKHLKLVQEGGRHYEVCLVDKSISAALMANRDFDVGSLTDGNKTGESLLKGSRLRNLLEATVLFLTKIDLVGMQNMGTMLRLDQQAPRHARSQLPTLQSYGQPLPSRKHVSGLGSAGSIGGSHVLTEIPRPVPGTRMNTQGALVVEPSGEMWQRGLGGARVPVVNNEAMGSVDDATVLPDDSASQAGGRMRSVIGGAGGAPRSGRNSAWAPVDNKPQGFW